MRKLIDATDPGPSRAATGMNTHDLLAFERARSSLLGIARRILGSRADAEDAVQECFLRWIEADRTAISSPAAWLATVCTRRCLDLLRAAHRSRVDYVGVTSAEPLESVAAASPDEHLGESLEAAFLRVLERLTPKERAAWLLHEIVDQPFRQIAATLRIREGACQKLVERARLHIQRGRTRYATAVETQARLLCAFRSAISTGCSGQLAVLLARDVHLVSRKGATGGFQVLEGRRQAPCAPTRNSGGSHDQEFAGISGADRRGGRQDGRTSQRAA